jgi:hypothetical protein
MEAVLCIDDSAASLQRVIRKRAKENSRVSDMDLLNRRVENICNRKIFLFGNEQIKSDVEYLFKHRGLDLKTWDAGDDAYFKTVGREDQMLVVCEKERNEAFEINAEKAGMKQGQDYLYVKEFFLHYNPVFLERRNRTLAVWGTGICASVLWDTLEKWSLASEIDFYVDNAKGKSAFKGKQVVSPKEIKDWKEIYVIVATSQYQWEIYKQLNEYGLQKNKDYIHYSVASQDYVELLEKACFPEVRYPYFCHRPFGYCDVIGSDLHLCCPDFLPISAGSMQAGSFMECWDSYVARILRLSILNGTFAFCNKQYCDLFDFDESIKPKEGAMGDYKREASQYPNTLMVGTDYSCNLNCPSCREAVCVASSEERKELDRQAEDLLEHVIPHVGRLWMAGSGEVFFSKTYRNMMEDKRCKDRRSISILSNGTLFNEEQWEKIEACSYESVEVVISMDGIKDTTIETLRRGADAQKLKHNLEFIGNLRKQNKIQRLFLSCVLQAANVAELQELLDYCQKIGVDKIQFLKLKDNGEYACDDEQFSGMSVFDKDNCLKERYKPYFTKALLSHPLADWFNSTSALRVEKRPRIDEYDTF